MTMNYQLVRAPATDELCHWKYLKRYKVKGKWRYVYDTKTALNDLSKTVNSASKKITSTVSDTFDKVDKAYDKVFRNNIYATNSRNYQSKIKQVEQTKEWKDIVSRKDPEYCVKNADGTYTYKIDDYLVKKKHQTLDMLDDIANGRPVTTNDMSVDTIVACANDYLQAGFSYIAIRAKILMTAIKWHQGSYDDDVERGINTINSITKAYSDAKKEVERSTKSR